MKKTIIILSLACLILRLAACKAEDPENVFEMPQTESVETTEMVVLATEPPATEAELEVLTDYQYGNMQKNIPSGDFMAYGDEILFFRNLNGQVQLLALDKAKGEVTPFCKDATCTHTAVKCISNRVFANLEPYDGKLYAMNAGWKIMELQNDGFEQIVDGEVYRFWHANGNMYAVTRDSSLVVFEKGSSSPRVLIEEYIDYWNVVFGQYLYGCSSEGISRVDLSAQEPQKEIIVQGTCNSMIDGKHIYYDDVQTNYLYRCKMDGSESVQLTDVPVAVFSCNFDDEYLYFRLFTDGIEGQDSHDVYRMSKEDPTRLEKIAELPESVHQIFTVPGYDKIFVTNWRGNEPREEDREESRIYLVAKDGSSVELLEFPDF